MGDNSTKTSIRVEIDGVHADLFEQIKNDNNFKHNTEVVRYCISEASKQAEFRLKDSHWKKITRLLSYDYLRFKYNIDSVPTFVNKAIETYIENIETKIDSIASFEVRSMLEGLELDVALAFLECQSENVAGHVEVKDLARKMEKRNLGDLTNILDSFVNRGLLQVEKGNGKTYYHAPSP